MFKLQKRAFLIMFIVITFMSLTKVNGQQCLSGGCTTFVKEYPIDGAPYNAPTNWQVLKNPAKGTDALMNAGNYTRFTVTAGTTYEWSYCETYGGVSTSWDAQLTLFDDKNTASPICFSTDFCGLAPYISWKATFTGTVRLLTTLYSSGGCKNNIGTNSYNKLVYRQLPGSVCTTPGPPASAVGVQTGQTMANLSWAPANPSGSSTVTYYWVVGTNPLVTYENGIARGTTTGTNASTSALTCGTTYYLRVFASSSCDATNSGYVTSAPFTTSACGTAPVNGIDIHNNTISSWVNIANQGGIKFSYIKATESTYSPYDNFHTNAELAVNQKITVGAYHFATPLFSPGYYQTNYYHQTTAISEATNFVNAAYTKYHYIGNGFLPPALDVEDQIVSFTPSNGYPGNVFVNVLTGDSYYIKDSKRVALPRQPVYMTAGALAQWIHDWATEVFNQTGKNIMPIVYCNKSYAKALYPYFKSGLIESKLWIAAYETAGSPNVAGYEDWTWLFQQYSSEGNVPGISPPVDLDVFNGDLNAFNNLINTKTALADLTLNVPTISPTTIGAGGNINVSCSEGVSGPVGAAANDVTIWLSTDGILKTNEDVKLGEISFSNLPANSDSPIRSATVQVPPGTPPGNYYIFFWADGNLVVPESNDDNNFASKQIAITAAQSLPDLIIQNAKVSPSTVSAGQQITVSCVNKNQGTANAGASYTAIWLSADQKFDGAPTDIRIDDIIVPALNAGQTSDVLSKQITLPSGNYTGNWYIMFGADGSGVVNEDKTNDQAFIPISFSDCTNVVLSINPTDQTISANSTASFVCTISAGTNVSYLWQYSADNGNTWNDLQDGATYSGTTSSTLSISSATSDLNGYLFRCHLSNDCSSVYSMSAKLAVTAACTAVNLIATPPDQTITANSSATFATNAMAGTNLSYEWQYSPDNGNTWSTVQDGGIYSGSSSPTLLIFAVTNDMNGYKYRCRLYNECSSAFSIPATLIVNSCALVAVSSNPSDQTVNETSQASFNCEISAGTNVSYLWQYSADNGNTWNDLQDGATYSGTTSSTLSIVAATSDLNGYLYRCHLSNDCSSANSLSAKLAVTAACTAVNLIATPPDQTITANSSATFATNAMAGTNLSYEWQYSPDNGNTWSTVPDGGIYSGSSSPTLLISAVTSDMNGHKYRCWLYNECSSAFSIPATLIVNAISTVTFPPIPAKVYGNANFDAGATSPNIINYTSSNLSIATIVSGQIHITGVGSTNITATDGNSNVIQSLTVDPATITVKADDKSKITGQPNPVLTISYAGFVNGEDLSVLTATPMVSTTAVDNSLPGSYPITATGASALNYIFNYVSGVLSINPIPLPQITGFSPSEAIEGTTVTIVGENLNNTSSVSFGGVAATSVTAVSSTEISAVVGKGSSGTISVTTPGGTSTIDGFHYKFILPATNFKISTSSATCKGSATGIISVTATQNMDYTVLITGPGNSNQYDFTTTKEISDLLAGVYNVCIKIKNQPDYIQCFGAVITEPKDLSLYSMINQEQNTVLLNLDGGSIYNIKLNEKLYTTSLSSITLPLNDGVNQLEVSTDKLCQGIIQRLLTITNSIIPFPDPFQNTLNINLGNKKISDLIIEIRGASDGKQVFLKRYQNQSGVIKLDVASLNGGVYGLHLTMDGKEKIIKIIKK